MTVGVFLLGLGLLLIGFQFYQDWKNRNGLSFVVATIILFLFAGMLGVIVGAHINNDYATEQTMLPMTFTPDTLIVTGYVLAVDTLLTGE
jgi:hypothetical protein